MAAHKPLTYLQRKDHDIVRPYPQLFADMLLNWRRVILLTVLAPGRRQLLHYSGALLRVIRGSEKFQWIVVLTGFTRLSTAAVLGEARAQQQLLAPLLCNRPATWKLNTKTGTAIPHRRLP